jgi:hypothetical protein
MNSRETEEGTVEKENLGRHDSIASGSIETALNVLVVENVTVRKDGNLDGLLDSLDLLPVSETLHTKESPIKSVLIFIHRFFSLAVWLKGERKRKRHTVS